MATEWIYSVVMIVPEAQREAANRLAEGLGHGPGNFANLLSESGNLPATHAACFTAAQQSFVDMLTAVGGGQLPVIDGMTPEEVGGVLMVLDADVALGVVASDHVRSVLEARNLKVIAES